MRLHRFYVQQPLGEAVHIDDRELVHQWSSVFRYTIGDSVLLFSLLSPRFDYEYEITDISKTSATLKQTRSFPNIVPKRPSALYMAIVKKDTFETVVRQATELMITDIVPVLASRSEKKGLNFDRLLSIVTEAAEQCGRGSIPTIHPIISFEEASVLADETHVIFDRRGGPLSEDIQKTVNAVWIGPEGGWADDEIDILTKKRVTILSLGTATLKADTAAIVGMSTVFL